MASGIRTISTFDHEGESFHKFFECWLSEQNQKLQELISVSNDHHDQHHTTNGTNTDDMQLTQQEVDVNDNDNQVLSQLVNRIVEHYELYYRAKSRWAKQDVLLMMTPSWTSSLEDAFLWIGGWRPSMAFHLLYSKSGLQLEAQLSELILGLSTGDLADLSAVQLGHVDELHRRTISAEKDQTEKMAKHQETVADSTMVELSHVMTELIQSGGGGGGGGGGVLEEKRVESTLAPKEEGWEEILAKADDLRLRTLKSILEILTPIQGVHFLIAAAELHLRFHEWGKKRDARNGGGHVQNGNGPGDTALAH